MREIGYDNILSFDEVGFVIDMIPKKGWSKKGTRCVYSGKRRGHEHITGTFLISSKGIEKWWLSKEGMNIQMMLKYLDEFPVSNKIIVLDNLRTHHNKDVIERMKSKNLTPKFTLPYSPELNPIEEVFSWLQRELRNEIIQNRKDLESNLERLISKFNSSKDVINYYKHSYDN